MKAMWAGFAAMIVITVGAWGVLGQSGFSSADVYSGSAVRLD
ncbi:MAG: hypothetical protein N4A70_06785 [Pelagimonas sp.]|jgi:hypothetical protein|nr:hypothetical protein [Pelagimonas sp.]